MRREGSHTNRTLVFMEGDEQQIRAVGRGYNIKLNKLISSPPQLCSPHPPFININDHIFGLKPIAVKTQSVFSGYTSAAIAPAITTTGNISVLNCCRST